MRAQQLVTIFRSRPAAPPSPGGGLVPIGDQESFSEVVETWDGLEPAPTIGQRYAPFDTIDSVGEIEYGTANTSFQTGRLHAWGPWELPEPAESILSVFVPLRCGATPGAFRFGIYADNGSMLDSTTDVLVSGSYPAALIAMSAEQSLAANLAPTEYEIVLNTGAVGAGFLYGAFWRNSVASGADPIIFRTGVITRLWRTTSGNPSYSSAGAAPATFPAGASGVSRHSGQWWATYRPVAPTAPTGLTATANADRSITLEWTNTDSRTNRARIKRRRTGEAWPETWAAVVEGESHTDLDLQVGITYEYYIQACYKNNWSVATATVSAVAAGVRTATMSFAATLLTRTPDDTLRGLYGLTHNLAANTNPSISQSTGYKRTGGTEWGDIQPTSDPSVFDWSEYAQHLNELSAVQRSILRTRHAVSRLGNQLPPFVTANSSYYSIANESDGTTTWFANLGVAQVWTWAQAWIASFGLNFANDQRVVLMKVGIHNRFGEWSGSMPAAAEISVARQIEIIDRMLAAFPSKKFIMSCTPDHDVMWYAAQQPQIIAFEQLSLGDAEGPNQFRRFWGDTPPRVRKKIQERMLGKWAEHKDTDGSGDSSKWITGVYEMEQLAHTMLSDRNMSLAINMPEPNNSRMAAQVNAAGYRFDLPRAIIPAGIVRGQPFRTVLFWRNAGNGVYPPVEARYPVIELRQAGAVAWTSDNGRDLTTFHPSAGALAVEQVHNVTGILPGSYQVCVRGRRPLVGGVERTDVFSLPLGIAGRQSDGYYVLGTITVS